MWTICNAYITPQALPSLLSNYLPNHRVCVCVSVYVIVCACVHVSVRTGVCLQKALELMSLVPKRCNDMMNLGRLQGYEVCLSVSLSVTQKNASRKSFKCERR